MLSASDNKRFWDSVEINLGGCWLWKGSKDDKGYGLFWSFDHERSYRAHRLSFQLVHGFIPEELLLMHDPCHTPSCCNPAHLIPGSHQANMAERNALGRQARGEKHGQAKLTVVQVLDIRTRLAGKEPAKRIARHFGISSTAVRFIRDGKTWAHVQLPEAAE